MSVKRWIAPFVSLGAVAAAVLTGCTPAAAPPPTFTSTSVQPVSNLGIGSTVIGDVSGDGRADLIAGAGPADVGGTGRLTEWTQGTDHKLRAPRELVDHAVYNSQARIALGDVNGDGKQDVVLAGDTGGIDIYRQVGGGLLGSPIHLDITATDVQVADVNADGRADLLVGDPDGLVLYLQQPDGGYGPYQRIGPPIALVNQGGLGYALKDADGRYDVLGSESDGFWISRQNADHTFAPAVRYYIAPGPDGSRANSFGISLADMNGDGIQDVVQTSSGSSDNSFVDVFLQTGSGTFKAPYLVKGTNVPTQVVGTDFNRDGYTDLASVDNGAMGVWAQLADGTFTEEADFPVDSAGWAPRGLSAGDLNGDGKPDLAFAGFGGGPSQVALLYQK